MLRKDTQNLGHLRFDAREALRCLTLVFAAAALQLDAIASERRLATGKSRHRFFEPVAGNPYCRLPCNGGLRSARDYIRL